MKLSPGNNSNFKVIILTISLLNLDFGPRVSLNVNSNMMIKISLQSPELYSVPTIPLIKSFSFLDLMYSVWKLC